VTVRTYHSTNQCGAFCFRTGNFGDCMYARTIYQPVWGFPILYRKFLQARARQASVVFSIFVQEILVNGTYVPSTR